VRTPLVPQQIAEGSVGRDMNPIAMAVAVAVLLPVCFWVYKDARLRYNGFAIPLGWAVLVFLALIMFLPLYLIFRPPQRNAGSSSDPRDTES
jgi:hypothetical protein